MASNSSAGLVTMETTPLVATITLNSPRNRNALSTEMMSALLVCINDATSSASRIIVLTHTDVVFCSGLDLKNTANVDLSGLTKLILALRSTPKPTVAVLTGPARAGGIGLMAACDLVIVASHINFAFTEVKIGAVPALVSVPIFERVNPSLLRAEFLTGEEFSATRALEVGLVTHVSDNPKKTADNLVLQMGSVGPNALQATIKLLREARSNGFNEQLTSMQVVSEKLFASDEAQEGMAAFREKRVPKWCT